MKAPFRTLAALMLGSLICCPASAVTVYKCVDASGNEYFADHCPPGSAKAGEKQLPNSPKQTEPDLAAIASRYPVVFYAVPDCDACDLVRNQLEKRGIPFTEKNAATDIAIQNELKELAGALTVPAVSVADQVVTNYNKAGLDSALDQAGYPHPKSPVGE